MRAIHWISLVVAIGLVIWSLVILFRHPRPPNIAPILLALAMLSQAVSFFVTYEGAAFWAAVTGTFVFSFLSVVFMIRGPRESARTNDVR